MNFRESSIEEEVCGEALKLGVWSIKLNLLGNRSWPDRLFLIPGGRPLLIEFKQPGQPVKGGQAQKLKILNQLEYDAEEHDTVTGAVEAVRQALERAARRGSASALAARALHEARHEVPPRAGKRRTAP